MSHTLRRTLTVYLYPFYHDVRVSLHGSCLVIERSRLQNLITLRLVFYSWQVLASFVYSARILEEFHLIHYLLSPTIPSLHTLRDREQWLLHTIKSLRLISQYSCPSIKCILLYRSDAPSRFAVQTSGLLFCYLLLRNGWHSISGVKALTNITNGVFSFMLCFLPARGHQFLLDMLITKVQNTIKGLFSTYIFLPRIFSMRYVVHTKYAVSKPRDNVIQYHKAIIWLFNAFDRSGSLSVLDAQASNRPLG